MATSVGIWYNGLSDCFNNRPVIHDLQMIASGRPREAAPSRAKISDGDSSGGREPVSMLVYIDVGGGWAVSQINLGPDEILRDPSAPVDSYSGRGRMMDNDLKKRRSGVLMYGRLGERPRCEHGVEGIRWRDNPSRMKPRGDVLSWIKVTQKGPESPAVNAER
uniref:Uncharacterized protein n=1 Tax=Parascaris univalens TaxID=6257 RepID=A0A915CHM4_PARUN